MGPVYLIFASGVCYSMFPSLPWDFYIITHTDPAAHKDYCGRCRIRTRALCPRSLVHCHHMSYYSEDWEWKWKMSHDKHQQHRFRSKPLEINDFIFCASYMHVGTENKHGIALGIGTHVYYCIWTFYIFFICNLKLDNDALLCSYITRITYPIRSYLLLPNLRNVIVNSARVHI